jgi:hypothetical protein
MSLAGVLGRPYLCLDALINTDALVGLEDEIALAFTRIPPFYTGGSHRSMGIAAPSRAAEVQRDYGEVIALLDSSQFATLRSLADVPEDFPALDARASCTFGEERDIPLSQLQLRWLEVRHSVYFPWKHMIELMPTGRWAEKDDVAGKHFTLEAETLLPNTLAFLRALPLEGIGRANLMGLAANDYGTVHRDGERDAPAEFIMLCPGPPKTLFLWDEVSHTETDAVGRAYWFNDRDFHGVRAAPYFRYSLRVDGPFSPAFRQSIAKLATCALG